MPGRNAPKCLAGLVRKTHLIVVKDGFLTVAARSDMINRAAVLDA